MTYRLHDPFERVTDRCVGEVEPSFGYIAGPSRRHRSYGRIDVFVLRSDSIAGLLTALVKSLESWFASGCACASAWLFDLHHHSLPNQALLTTPISRPFCFQSRQYGVSDL